MPAVPLMFSVGAGMRVFMSGGGGGGGGGAEPLVRGQSLPPPTLPLTVGVTIMDVL